MQLAKNAAKKFIKIYLTAIDRNGKLKWQMPYGLACRQSFPESRCTPTVEGNRIYVISGRGEIVCVDAENGKKFGLSLPLINLRENVVDGKLLNLHLWSMKRSGRIKDRSFMPMGCCIAMKRDEGMSHW